MIVQGVPHSLRVKIRLSGTPELNTPGFFIVRKEKKRLTQEIDYSKLNEQIVRQAYKAAGVEMTPEQLQDLINKKFERARLYSEAAAKAPTFSVN